MVAAQLAVHPDVVVRVLGSFGPKPGTPRPEARVLEPYLCFISETLDRYPRLVATRLYDMLRERGYTGSLRTLRRHVRHVRPKRLKSEAILRSQTLPGEQAQVDWAHVGDIAVPGGRRPLWAFVMVLAYSRASFAELVVSLDIHSLRRSLVRAAIAFGGLPRQWLFDNAKTIVIERRGDAIRFHDDLLDLAGRLPCDSRAADLFFNTVSRRHERRSVVITTNLAYKQWGAVFHDASCLGALVDRFAQHCHTVDIDADSWRDRHSIKRTSPRKKK